ncbi:polysaccharide pyruvyl transferase family protein [Lachnospiraceae bacterium 48-21]
MKNIILFDVAVGTTNKGDDIIMQSAAKGLAPVLKGNYVVNIPTHITPFSWFQTKIWWKAKWVRNADIKFICGTNLLAKTLLRPVNDLNINLWNCSPMADSVLVGVGNSVLHHNIDVYTKAIYKKVLSRQYVHSTRDVETKDMLESMGFRAVVTGCPTLWSLTPEHCLQIPCEKSDRVIFTLTGVQRDPKRDQKLIDILQKNYKEVFFYDQTIWDMEYFLGMRNIEGIKIVGSSLSEYGDVLDSGNIEYVGTRLHGGVFAMQHKVRSLIVNIDNRARNMSKVNNFNIIERDDIEELEDKINSRFETNVRMDYELLDNWLSQFY